MRRKSPGPAIAVQQIQETFFYAHVFVKHLHTKVYSPCVKLSIFFLKSYHFYYFWCAYCTIFLPIFLFAGIFVINLRHFHSLSHDIFENFRCKFQKIPEIFENFSVPVFKQHSLLKSFYIFSPQPHDCWISLISHFSEKITAKTCVPEIRAAMDKFKIETAAEVAPNPKSYPTSRASAAWTARFPSDQ